MPILTSLPAAFRTLGVLALLSVLSGCFSARTDAPVATPIGELSLGFVAVSAAPNYTVGPLSREATLEDWIDPLKQAVDTRLLPLVGERMVHLGVLIQGFALAKPGVPIVLSPKSALVFRLVVIDDASETMVFASEQLIVFEDLSVDTVVGSGFSRTRDDQIEALSQSAALKIETVLRENYDAIARAFPADPAASEDVPPAQ